MEDCRQGIDVRFYSKTPCNPDTVYPQVNNLRLFVFDRNGQLVSYKKEDRGDMLYSGYKQTMMAGNGLFTVVAWTGVDIDPFLREKEIVTKNNLLFRIQRTAQQSVSLDGKRVYFGESPMIFLPDPAEYGSLFESTAINLQEMTNRIRVQIEGLSKADDYEVFIESANGSMNVDGSIATDEMIRYTAQPVFTEGVLEANLTFLKLTTGYNTTLVVKDKRNNRELYRGDLLGTLLLKNPGVNLACDHDFTIRFATKDQCECGTYMIMEIWVNNWLVHSYDTDLK
ncbi:hypothetical protein FACS1894155_09510 [Bacteroidia bacterium]|nr:hypothetical protein FACS1894155_09510 [Bacteroidia bacterium]